jgi:hypothetical protein
VCGADAISGVVRSDTGKLARVAVHCGACDTWRVLATHRRRAAALERRLASATRHDRRRMARAVTRASRDDAPPLHAVAELQGVVHRPR